MELRLKACSGSAPQRPVEISTELLQSNIFYNRLSIYCRLLVGIDIRKHIGSIAQYILTIYSTHKLVIGVIVRMFEAEFLFFIRLVNEKSLDS